MNRPKISSAVPASSRRPRVSSLNSSSSEGGGLYFSSPRENVECFSSGCTLLDCVLGTGKGWALGRVSNIVGDKSTGKTLLAMESAANFLLQFPGGRVKYKEAEAAFDSDYARALSIPMDRIDLEEDLDTVEGMFRDLDNLIKTTRDEKPVLYIVDSLDALSDDAEMERAVGEGTYGTAKAKLMGEMFRKLVRKLRAKRIAVMIISQVRDAIGVTFGKKHTRSGGKALDFYASQVIWLSHIKRLERTVGKIKRPTGVIIKAMCEKNKVGLPFRNCEFEITFGYGVEDEKASRTFLAEIGKPTNAAGEELRRRTVEEWFKIEKSFLPTRTKYGV